ncbi:2-isopropylmalate synthase [Pseudochryseolinea flava]|uniref:2-isopropylmalate synthase n=2 Tax=Pseudochryseolinea flava TaxID=2059302 RepID=A0A364Y4W1_9BACT|nr:2-isopropylmalate synthase [Pseudochryseolinea flava]
MYIEIMDTTLRDGEQTSGVSYTATEKLNIAKMLLEEVKVDRIEIASARISDGEYEAALKILKWGKDNNYLDRIEILGFVDDNRSLDWIHKAGGKVINLLCKGSLKHVQGQLRKSPEEHVADIKKALAHAETLGIKVNVYFEDWSNGMRNSPEYVFFLTHALKDEKIARFMLPDTLGVLNPDEAFSYMKQMVDKFPGLHFDLHAHNDYDLSVANCFAGVKAGAAGLHVTVNGLGERAGNTPLSSVVAMLKDHLQVNFSVDEAKLVGVSKLVEVFSGIGVPKNKPVVGEHVFTQTCGVHADGDNKGNLYHNELIPERFGRSRKYALGKTSGNASIKKNLEELGIELDPESLRRVTQRVVELGDKKENISTEDLPYIISDVLGREAVAEKIKIRNYYSSHVYNLKPVSTLSIEIDGKVYEATSTGDGQYDAFMQAVKSIYDQLGKKLPQLTDYEISIPPGGRTDAFVETIITWELDEWVFKTRGFESDQQAAAITATLKMLNLVESKVKA